MIISPVLYDKTTHSQRRRDTILLRRLGNLHEVLHRHVLERGIHPGIDEGKQRLEGARILGELNSLPRCGGEVLGERAIGSALQVAAVDVEQRAVSRSEDDNIAVGEGDCRLR